MVVRRRHAQKIESLKQLGAGIAHELNPPVQFIGDNTRFLRDSFLELKSLLKILARLQAAVPAGPMAPALLADKIERTDGVMIVGAGTLVTLMLFERHRNFAAGNGIREPILVE